MSIFFYLVASHIFLFSLLIWGRFLIWLIFFRWVETTTEFFLRGIMPFVGKNNVSRWWFSIFLKIFSHLPGEMIRNSLIFSLNGWFKTPYSHIVMFCCWRISPVNHKLFLSFERVGDFMVLLFWLKLSFHALNSWRFFCYSSNPKNNQFLSEVLLKMRRLMRSGGCWILDTWEFCMEFLQSPPKKNVDFFQKLVGAWISDDHDGRYKIGWYEDTLSFMGIGKWRFWQVSQSIRIPAEFLGSLESWDNTGRNSETMNSPRLHEECFFFSESC